MSEKRIIDTENPPNIDNIQECKQLENSSSAGRRRKNQWILESDTRRNLHHLHEMRNKVQAEQNVLMRRRKEIDREFQASHRSMKKLDDLYRERQKLQRILEEDAEHPDLLMTIRQEIEDLNEKLVGYNELHDRCRKLEAEKTHIEEHWAKTEDEINHIEDEINRIEDGLSFFSRVLEEKNSFVDARFELDKTREAKEILEKMRDELSARCYALEKERDSLRQQQRSSSAENSELAQKIQDISADLQVTRKELQEKILEQEIKDAELQDNKKKLEEIELKRKDDANRIKNALSSLQSPNSYVKEELCVYRVLFYLYSMLAFSFFVVLLVTVFFHENATNIQSPPIAEEDTPVATSGTLSLYDYLERHTIHIVSISLLSVFITLMSKTRRRIQELQERKRGVELFRGGLLAINELSDSPDKAMKRIDNIIEEFAKHVMLYCGETGQKDLDKRELHPIREIPENFGMENQ